MSLRVLLVDDEALARRRMRTLLADCEIDEQAVIEAADAAEALQLMKTQRFDLALLDIHMPGLSGMGLATALRTFAEPPAIVFVTAYAQHAAEAFDLDVADYLTKPVRLERLQKALAKAKMQRSQMPESVDPDEVPADVLLVPERHRVVRLPIPELIYARAELKYLTLRTADQTLIYDGSLAELEQRWPQRFVRTHRSVLVSKAHMRALEREDDGWVLQLQGVAERVPVSRRQLAVVREALTMY